MFCSNCGKQLDDNAKFCMNCGTPVAFKAAVEAAVSAAPTVFPVGEVTTPQPVQQVSYEAPVVPEPVQTAPALGTPVPTNTQVEPFTAPQQTQYAATQDPFASQVQIPAAATTLQPQQTPVAVPPSATNTGVQVPKKKSRLPLIILAVVLLVAIAGGLFAALSNANTKKKAEDLYNQGMEAYYEEDYDTAVDLFDQALALDEDNKEYKRQLANALVDRAYDYFNVLDYRHAIDDILRAVSTGTLDDMDPDSLLNALYNLWIIDCINNEQYTEGLEILEEAEPYLTSEEYEDRLYALTNPVGWGEEPVEEPTSGELTATDLESLARRVAYFADNDQYERISLDVPTYENLVLRALNGQDKVSVSLTDSNFDTVIFYPYEGSYAVYYGDADSQDNREGLGFMFAHYVDSDGNPAIYLYICQWEDDIPNGQFIEINRSGQSFLTSTEYQGYVVSGLYDGDIEIDWTNYMTYYAHYDMGVPEIYGTDEETGYPIFAYTEDHDFWLYYTGDLEPIGLEPIAWSFP